MPNSREKDVLFDFLVPRKLKDDLTPVVILYLVKIFYLSHLGSQYLMIISTDIQCFMSLARFSFLLIKTVIDIHRGIEIFDYFYLVSCIWHEREDPA